MYDRMYSKQIKCGSSVNVFIVSIVYVFNVQNG